MLVIFGFFAFFLILITSIGKILKKHLNLKTWNILHPLNHITLIIIFIHGILFDLGLRNISILILFTILFIISIQTNIYGRFKIEKKIKEKNKLQNIISKFSSRFSFTTSINKGINEFLQDLGKLSGADRAYLFLFDKKHNLMNNTHEWTNTNVTPQIQILQNLSFEMFPWWVNKINNKKSIHIKDVSKLPTEASTEKEILENQEIKSLLVFPIIIMNEPWGFLGLDNIQNTNAWDENDFKLLQISAELIGKILERKSILKDLDLSEEKYKTITENANDIIVILNEKFQLEYINEITSKKLLGANGTKVLGTNPVRYVHPEDRKRVLKALNKGLEHGEGIIEARIRHKLGNYVWFELKGKKIFDKKENEFKGIIIAREINERKKTEQKLKESEEKYRHLFKNSPSFIVLLDTLGQIIDCNHATEQITEYSREDLIGRYLKDLSIVHPKFLPIVQENFRLQIKGKNLTPLSIQIHKKNGSFIWINYTSSLVKMADKNYVLIMGYETTKQKQAEILIKKELEKLKELEQMRKNLISRVSHELKTPLISIRGVTELFMERDGNNLNNEDMELFKVLERGEKRLEKLIKDLIDISRIEFKELKLKKQYINLYYLIKECIHNLKYLFGQKNLSLRLNLPKKLTLSIDPTRIEQVLANLLINAIKNTPSGGKVTICGKKCESQIEISIQDTGIGLTKKEKTLLFTRFGKIERYGEGLEEISIQGAGLGLFISKNLVEMHGGSIWAESEGRDKGSKFSFSLPIKK
jgi:PAS domain S-box-containing protein